MKFTVAFVLMVFCATAAVQSSSVFERTLKNLHRGPPPPLGTNRDGEENVVTEWIDQRLDNFDDSETRTWKMRYMANDAYFEAGAPIFIFVGGEWEISPDFLIGGHFHDIAKEHKGYLFYTEHRYYGQSRPTSDLRTSSLKYLRINQALADLAHFIRTVKSNIAGLQNSKVILAGGSYSATMVTWFKKTYPDLIVGAWSSSAPLFAKVDFVEYKEVTGRSIKQVGGQACYNRIQNGIAELENMFANKRSAEVKAMLKICNNFNENNDLDIWSLFSSISNVFAGIVQYHYHYYGTIQAACNEIMKPEDDVTGLTKFILDEIGGNFCLDFSYKSMILYLSESSYTGDVLRQWYYQTCNEYGWYQTSGSPNQPFGSKFPVTLSISTCNDVYGDKFTNSTIYLNADVTNFVFGGLNPEVENVYTTHGELDPWSAMGITDKDRATVIPLHAHCMDFGSISQFDTAEMKASKEKIAQLVREWVRDDSVAKTQRRKFMRQLYKNV